jgi:hypothetical protein
MEELVLRALHGAPVDDVGERLADIVPVVSHVQSW